MKAFLGANGLRGLRVMNAGEAVGHVDEFYFDDQSWRIRYLVLDVGSWLSGRKVLVSPATIVSLEWDAKSMNIKATKDEIRKSPDVSTELPVALVLEAQIHRHFAWDYYWPEMFPMKEEVSEDALNKTHDPHLRSTRVLSDISVVTEKGKPLGRIEEFLIDPKAWRIDLLRIDHGKVGSVLLSPELVKSIDVSRREILISPPW